MAMPKISLAQREKLLAGKNRVQEKKGEEGELLAFINRAPDGDRRPVHPEAEKRVSAKGRPLKGRRVIITHSILPEDLEALDAMVAARSMTRSGYLNMLIKQELVKFFGPGGRPSNG